MTLPVVATAELACPEASNDALEVALPAPWTKKHPSAVPMDPQENSAEAVVVEEQAGCHEQP